MILPLITALFLVTCGMPALNAQVPGMAQTQADFEKLAAEIPYLCLSSVLYDRPGRFALTADPKKSEQYFRILAKVTDSTYPREALSGLLTHGDPKVRTLAAVALFDREDPKVLPLLVKLCNDDSATFDGPPELTAIALPKPGMVLPGKKQTLGEIAMMMVSMYMKYSGFHYGIAHITQPGFNEYWIARSNRSHCAGWFAVQLARASHGTTPTQTDCIPRIRLLRQRIDQLPPEERAWTLLWLNGESGSDALATTEELMEAGMTLGPDKLLLMLQKQIPCDDPDLQPRTNNNWPYKRMQIFVLRHAKQLLRPGDGDTLLACERWERDYQKHGITDPTITPWWAIAAAHLQSGNASQILHAALQRFQGKFDSDHRAALCIAMWQLCGSSELKFIVDWFLDELPQIGSFPNCRGQFIEALRAQASSRELFAEIIKDNRLDHLDWQSLERLVRSVNAWTKSPIATEQELHKARHPLGKGHYHWQKDKAMKDYPKETEELEAHLNDWRKRLRMSVPELLGVTANRPAAPSKPLR